MADRSGTAAYYSLQAEDKYAGLVAPVGSLRTTIVTTALLAITDCTADDYDGCHGTNCLVNKPVEK